MMSIKTSIFSLGALLVAQHALADQMQINYYNDDQCTSYLGDVGVTWAGDNSLDNCYNYHYGSSVNIAECNQAECYCLFYKGADCTGNSASAIWGGSDCIKNSADYYSFACAYR